VVSNEPFFKEFAVQCPTSVEALNEDLLEWGILGGYGLERAYPELQNQMLVCVTEMTSRDGIDYFVEALREVSA
jgi:glycine dehydrogenase subunit 1